MIFHTRYNTQSGAPTCSCFGAGVTAKAIELQLGKLRKNGESPSASPKKSNAIKSESFGPDESAKIDASTPKRFSSRKRPLKSYAELSDSDSEDDVVPESPTKIKKIEKAVKLEGDISRSPDSLTPDEQWHI